MIERFSPTHYVPLLRWKRGEQVALLKMKAEDAMRLTPLVELVNENFMDRERNLLNNDVVIEKITLQLIKYWCERPLFIDLGFLSQNILSGRDFTRRLVTTHRTTLRSY